MVYWCRIYFQQYFFSILQQNKMNHELQKGYATTTAASDNLFLKFNNIRYYYYYYNLRHLK
jgi:hypothetical protein